MIQRALQWLASAEGRRAERGAISGNHRIAELDALRGLAAVVIMVHHFIAPAYAHRLFPRQESWLCLLDGGRQSVSLFFMISGFVILMTLDRKKSILDFGVSRITRLYPAYWAAILLTFAVVRICGLPGREVDCTSALVNLTMLQGFLGISSVDGVYWTLHCELCFYILMAFIVGLGMRRSLLTVVMIIVIGDLAYRGLEIPIYLPGSWRIRAVADNMHWFAIGILFYEMHAGTRSRHVLMLAVCLAAVCYSTYFGHHENVLQLACAMGVVLTMFVATRYRVPLLASRGLVFLGTISYSLYLVHRNIGMVIIRAGFRHGISERLSVAIAIASALAVAYAVTFAVERPGMRFLRRKYELWKDLPKADGVSPSST